MRLSLPLKSICDVVQVQNISSVKSLVPDTVASNAALNTVAAVIARRLVGDTAWLVQQAAQTQTWEQLGTSVLGLQTAAVWSLTG